MITLQSFSEWFWTRSFWLPPSLTWNDMKSTEDLRLPQIEDLSIVLPIMILIVFIRMFFEKYIAFPFLKWCGLEERVVRRVEPNEILEKVYNNLTGQLEQKQIKSLASRVGWTVRKVEQWFRTKSVHNRPSKMKKAKENCWRCAFYTFTSIWGIYVLRKERYLYDTQHFWIDYPKHNVSDEVFFYYVVELAFYFALLFSQFVDVKRKDFWVQTIHHVLTISLLVGSFVTNYVRIGAVILLVHDVSDVFLETAKVCKYLKCEKICDALFGIFAVVFFVSRLIVYPVWVIRSVVVEYPIFFSKNPMYYCLLGFLILLQIMHIFWFYLIARMAYTFLISGKLDKDARSETEESESDEPEQNGVLSNAVINDKQKMQ